MGERATKQTVKKGTLLLSTYGCTMHRASYWQVVEIIGSKVFLGHPKTEFKDTGYDAGHAILVGPSENPEPTQRAKFTSAGLKLCKRRYKGTDAEGREVYDDWAAGDHHWDLLRHVEPGHSEYTYGD